ncbi:MAG: chemotaxis protein CheB [Gammaproteobacteria bacterium]
MGADGAKGMKEMHDVGAYTIAQDQQSSVIWGMPGEAVKAQAVNCVLPLAKIPAKILALCEQD